MSLRSLPALLRHEPAMVDAMAVGSSALAVPDAAVALVVAGMCRLGERRPLLVVTATVVDAERLHHDVGAFLGVDAVELFPAWDTLPFERVSPELSTMGRRLRLLWRMQDPSSAPAVIVAPVRAVLQRLGSFEDAAAPVVVARGDLLDQKQFVARLVGLGYRREYQVEHRGELAVRGGIVDVFPSTAELPVRIDLWGDEVDRLTEFDPGDQRSVADLGEVELFGCREVLPTEAVRARAGVLVGAEPWGRSQWERLSQGLVFDGMESWLPWLVDQERVLPDLVGPGGRVVLVDPRRIRDRAAELNDEEAALAGALAVTWGVVPDDEAADPSQHFPRLNVAYERLLGESAAPVLSMVPVADSPSTPAIAARGFEPVHGDRALLAARLMELVSGGYSVTVCAEGEGSAARLAAVLAEEGMVVPVVGEESGGDGPDLSRPGVRIVVAPLERGVVVPAAKMAVLAEADFTGRRRAHRPVRARARPTDGFFDDLAPGDYVVHRQHGVARYAGMVTRTVHGASPRLSAARVPRRRQALPAVRPDRRAHPLQRGRVAHPQPPGRVGVAADPGQGARRGARDRPGARRAVPTTPAHQGSQLRPGLALAARARGRLSLHRDRRPAARHRGGEGGHGGRRAHGPPGVR